MTQRITFIGTLDVDDEAGFGWVTARQRVQEEILTGDSRVIAARVIKLEILEDQ
jgi:hypothetical protein